MAGQMDYIENFNDGEYEAVVAATAYAITIIDGDVSSKHKRSADLMATSVTGTKSKLEEQTNRTSFDQPIGTEAEGDEQQTG